MRNILITGGSGFLGQHLVRLLIAEYPRVERIGIYSRGEHRQAAMREDLRDDRLRWWIGDVRDAKRLQWAMSSCDTVIHAAALKRIEVGHYNPTEMIATNVLGSLNVVQAAADTASVRRVVMVSTDKAYMPRSAYGISKAMAECIVLGAQHTRSDDGPRYAVVRYGNVWGSTGSVSERWRAMVASGSRSVPVTNPECTRFFMRARQAAELVLQACTADVRQWPDAPIVPSWLPAYRLGDLADAMGVDTHPVGLPAWEKLHEGMADGVTSDVARRLTVDELREELGRG